MRVLHLDSGREMRGGQIQVLALLRGLQDESVLLTPGDGPLMRAAINRGIDARPLDMLAISTLARKVDVVHAHDARSHTWAATLAAGPLVVSRRVAFAVRRTFLSRWKYKRPQQYLAVSEHVKHTLLQADIPEQRISVVYDGVEIPPETAGGTTIVALATGDPLKGKDLVEQAAQMAGVEVCYSTDLAKDLPKAGLFIYITRSEGLGSAALFAMAHGVPVVASKVGGLPEIVKDCHSGILTDNDPAAIAQAIKSALRNREELGRNARLCVQERFSTRHMIDKTVAVYQQVVA